MADAAVVGWSLVAHSSSMQAGPELEEADARREVEGIPPWVVAMVFLLGVVPKEASPSVEVASTCCHLCPATEGGGAVAVTSRAGGPLLASTVEAQECWAVAAA